MAYMCVIKSCVNESCPTCVWMSHVPHMCEWVLSHICVDESCLTYVWISDVWLSHVPHMCEWVMSHIRVNESCPTCARMSHVSHMCEWVMSHMCVNESCLIYVWISCLTWMSHVSHVCEKVTFHSRTFHFTHERHGSFTYVRDMTHSHTCETWLIHTYVGHDSLHISFHTCLCETWLDYVSNPKPWTLNLKP